MLRMPGVLLAVSALAMTGCDFDVDMGPAERQDFHYSYDLKSNGRLDLETFNGSVEISGWDKETIEINGTKHAPTRSALDEIKIDIAATPDSIRIRSVKPIERRNNIGVKFVINVPKKVMLDRVVSTNGSIRIQQLEGNAKLRTSNGTIRASMMTGDLEGHTTNGTVELQNFSGSASVHTSNGVIRADRVKGYFSASTTNGAVEGHLVEPSGGRPVRVETTNGRVNLTVEGSKIPDIQASTTNGSITVRLPGNVNAKVKAHTSNSSINSEFDVTTQGNLSKHHLEGTIGTGGPLLDLQTSNGTIRLQKL